MCHQRRFDVPDSDITILGCSLWSHVPDDAQDAVRIKVNDFNKIKDWSVEGHNSAHQSDLVWLRAEMGAMRHEQNTAAVDGSQTHENKPKKRSIIIITHHAPCKGGTSEPRLASNPWNSAFGTDLLMGSYEWPDVKLLIFGYTHYSTEFVKDGIRVISNQRGYVLPGPPRQHPEGYGKGLWKVFDLRKVVGL